MVSNHKSCSNNHSPTTAPSSGPSGDDINTPTFKPKSFPSPWAQVVRGGDSESPTGIHQSLPSSTSSSSSSLTTGTADQTPSCDYSSKADSTPPPVDNLTTIASVEDSSDGSDGNAGGFKKHAWNKPSNGVVVETGPVMGAESWPALSEATKISGKLPAESSHEIAAATAGSPLTSQEPVISHSSQRQGTSNTKSSSATNNNVPNRPKPVKGVGDSNIALGLAQSSLSNPPTPPPLPPFHMYHFPPVSYRNMTPRIPSSSPRDHHWNNNWDARPLVRGSCRRGNFGSHPRGDGSYHQNNYRNMRDQDRGDYVNTRNAHVPQSTITPRGILRHPPHSNASFLGPLPNRPFPNPAELYYYPTTVILDPLTGVPFFPQNPSPAPFFPAAETLLSNVIVNQIDYYFSDANLVKDEFLKSNMDEEGWVPITLIANFRRVKSFTSNIQLILDSLKTSTVVDVQGDKLRRRNEWMKWLPSSHAQTNSGSVSPRESNYNNFTTEFQTINPEKTSTNEGESFRQSQLSNGSDDVGNINLDCTGAVI